MKTVKIELEVILPDGYSENKIDNAISELINDNFGGEVIDSKPYKEAKTNENNS